ncbi:hypothetical protein QYE76_057336 [Lolium multiflorum]|uniref:F-box domain-containing protein n=1 Tax=Lolium multiflorum TaxID=4521 RepID=A0AAD8T375_LOLMU|nr:hypothetical protein QYE76_057336 [Lolium multiflorum]
MPPPRRRKTEAAAAPTDALLSLPTDVLDDILARVGLRDAVRTSVLSRAWTRRWEFIPCIDISADDGGIWKAPSAVDGILLRFPGRVRRFHVSLDKATSCRVNDWLPTLSRRGVESLSLKLRSHGQYFRPPRLHESVFFCSSLTVLSLSTCTMPSFPLDWGFPNLRSLILSNVRFLEEYGHDQLQEIIETCPLLEDLRLVKVDLYGDIEFVMQAPKLRFLTLGFIEEFGCILQELPLLHSAAMDMWNYVPSNFAELLAALVQARNLQLRLCTEGGWEDGWEDGWVHDHFVIFRC